MIYAFGGECRKAARERGWRGEGESEREQKRRRWQNSLMKISSRTVLACLEFSASFNMPLSTSTRMHTKLSKEIPYALGVMVLQAWMHDH